MGLRTLRVAVLLTSASFAGCLGGDEAEDHAAGPGPERIEPQGYPRGDESASTASDDEARNDEDVGVVGLADADAAIRLGDRAAEGSDALLWDGRELASGDLSFFDLIFVDPTTDRYCGEDNCDRIPFELTFPDGYWGGHDGGVEVTVQAVEGESAHFALDVLDATGRTVAEGLAATYATMAILDEPATGAYEAVVVARSGKAAYTGVVQLEARAADPGPLRDVLPDLVVLPPLDLGVPDTLTNVMGVGPAAGIAGDALGVRGCDAWEIAEQGARRCLRLTNSVGNLGEGPLEVRLTFEEGAKAIGGQGRFVQRVHRSDGTFSDALVDGAEFHPTHGHFHYKDLAAFRLYRYDLDAHARGEQVAETTKSGFCFYDMGLVVMDHVGTTQPGFSPDTNCLLAPDEDWVTGLSPGWFDRYGASLSDQYVEITGLEDGVYELVSTANAAGTLVEADPRNNSAGAILRLTGNAVTVLETWADYLDGPPGNP